MGVTRKQNKTKTKNMVLSDSMGNEFRVTEITKIEHDDSHPNKRQKVEEHSDFSVEVDSTMNIDDSKLQHGNDTDSENDIDEKPDEDGDSTTNYTLPVPAK